MPIVPTSRGFVIVGPDGSFVAGPFPSKKAAEGVQLTRDQDAAMATALRAPARRHTPVAIPNGSGTYSITAGDGTGRVVAGPYKTKADADRTLAGWSLIDMMKPAPRLLRELTDVIAGHQPYNRINITPGYRSPDVEDGRGPRKP